MPQPPASVTGVTETQCFAFPPLPLLLSRVSSTPLLPLLLSRVSPSSPFLLAKLQVFMQCLHRTIDIRFVQQNSNMGRCHGLRNTQDANTCLAQ